MTLKALVPVADGVEDIETVTIVDVLRRAGIEVTVASLERDATVTCARGCRLTADRHFDEVAGQAFDLIACPGGAKGAERQGAHAGLVQRLRVQQQAGRWIAAICAAPALVLAPHGLLADVRATCYPSFRDRLPRPEDARVVVDRKVVTSQSPATALEFALKLVELLCGPGTRSEVGSAMLAAP